MRIICLLFYYGFAQYLPDSYLPIVGKISNAIRIGLVKHIFKKCGKITTINRLAYFGSGRDIEIGDYSGIGAKCVIPKNTIIGKYVMMAPEVVKIIIYFQIYQHLCVFKGIQKKTRKLLLKTIVG